MDRATEQELLIRVDERTKTMEQKLDLFIQKADNGGFKRCAERLAMVHTLAKHVDDLQEERKWLRRTVYGGLLTTMIGVTIGIVFV